MWQGLFYDSLRRITTPNLRLWFKMQKWFVPLSKLIFGNTVYSKSYFEDIERLEGQSMDYIADWICEYLKPMRIIDCGCGSGQLMLCLHQRNVDVFGVDVAPAAIKMAQEKGLPAKIFDLTNSGDILPGIPYDLVISCEVAEHLDEKHARTFVQKLSMAAPIVYLTAASPCFEGCRGLYHVNEKPNSYWIALMEEFNFQLDQKATSEVRNTLRKESVISYLQNPMIFRLHQG